MHSARHFREARSPGLPRSVPCRSSMNSRPVRRGPYGGGMGYVGLDGQMDIALAHGRSLCRAREERGGLAVSPAGGGGSLRIPWRSRSTRKPSIRRRRPPRSTLPRRPSGPDQSSSIRFRSVCGAFRGRFASAAGDDREHGPLRVAASIIICMMDLPSTSVSSLRTRISLANVAARSTKVIVSRACSPGG